VSVLKSRGCALCDSRMPTANKILQTSFQIGSDNNSAVGPSTMERHGAVDVNRVCIQRGGWPDSCQSVGLL